MAEGKKSFLIYADTIKNIEHLTYEEKGKLFQHLLEYVNDLEPILEDRLILTAWKPIETHLKRDLKKWTDKAPQRSEKARKAGLASAKARQLKATKSNSVVKNELKPTKSTVNVNVNVNDNVNDNVIKSIINKDAEFKNSLKPFLEIYGKDMLNDFFLYWTEKKPKGRKMRFEMEKTFDVSRRLKRWKNYDIGKGNSARMENSKKAKKPASEIIQEKYGLR